MGDVVRGFARKDELDVWLANTEIVLGKVLVVGVLDRRPE
jgi:hypothetical protein